MLFHSDVVVLKLLVDFQDHGELYGGSTLGVKLSAHYMTSALTIGVQQQETANESQGAH